MDELNAAPSSTEPTAEELASIAMGTNAQEAGAAALGESTAAAPDAGAATDFSAPSVSAETAPLTDSPAVADAPAVAASEWIQGEGDSGNADASAAAAVSPSGTAYVRFASTAGTSSPSGASSLDSLPSRVAVHLESIYQLAVDHVRQLIGPADVAKSELATEIDDLLHKLSNGIAVSDGRIVAKLAALRSLL
ncbi:hypothetical protein [Burkholderia cepacia]|uniref:hypothetical protein n=1 Tax=Burkholderia cepacia TaxID=292 RepID=UPI001F216C1B|nr:hypothetical protein [Burkholderia cepacia]UIY60065.1 hypothetical protein LZ568_18690 [Burkholderia cepacia]